MDKEGKNLKLSKEEILNILDEAEPKTNEVNFTPHVEAQPIKKGRHIIRNFIFLIIAIMVTIGIVSTVYLCVGADDEVRHVSNIFKPQPTVTYQELGTNILINIKTYNYDYKYVIIRLDLYDQNNKVFSTQKLKQNNLANNNYYTISYKLNNFEMYKTMKIRYKIIEYL